MVPSLVVGRLGQWFPYRVWSGSVAVTTEQRSTTRTYQLVSSVWWRSCLIEFHCLLLFAIDMRLDETSCTMRHHNPTLLNKYTSYSIPNWDCIILNSCFFFGCMHGLIFMIKLTVFPTPSTTIPKGVIIFIICNSLSTFDILLLIATLPLPKKNNLEMLPGSLGKLAYPASKHEIGVVERL